MSDFATSWTLSRQRFVTETEGLSSNQLTWTLYPAGLSIGQMAIHVAGVEMYFISQLLDISLDEEGQMIRLAATQGVVNSEDFPFGDPTITPEFVAGCLAKARQMVEPVITAPTLHVLRKEITSALGPVITGEGALARLAFHPAYHQGQAYQMRQFPGFPAS